MNTNTHKPIVVAEPKFYGNEKVYVNDCLDSGWISSKGAYIERFEAAFAEFCGVKHAIATNNGTTALHLALVALGLEEGDEVIIPTVTYIATANAVRYCNAVPVLVDSDPRTMNISPEAIRAKITPKTKGIIPVHLYGHPADMEAVMEIAREHNLFVLEDAAEAHGAECNGKRVGAWGDCATFSFFGNKIITTGEGGMITTNDTELAAKLRLYRSQGMDPQRRYWFPVIGYNYRMTNIQAAIGLAQLENIHHAIGDRVQIASLYNEAFSGTGADLVLPVQQPWARHVYWMYTVYLNFGGEAERDAVMAIMAEDGIETRPVFYPMHVLPPYLEDTSYPVGDMWAGRGINLPTHSFITPEDIQRVSASIKQAISRVKAQNPAYAAA